MCGGDRRQLRRAGRFIPCLLSGDDALRIRPRGLDQSAAGARSGTVTPTSLDFRDPAISTDAVVCFPALLMHMRCRYNLIAPLHAYSTMPSSFSFVTMAFNVLVVLTILAPVCGDPHQLLVLSRLGLY